MKVSLDWNFKNLDGSEMDVEEIAKDNIHAGRQVATQLAGSRDTENVIKFWGWAQSLYKKDELELDKADINTLRNFVEKNQTLSLLARAQVISYLDDVKQSENKN